MLNYEDLTPSQRKWVDMTVMFFPNITTTVSWQQVNEIHEFFLEKRKEDKRYKVGLPLWLTKENLVSRGLYHFPKNGNFLDSDIEIDTEIEQAYKAELKEYGILKE